VDILFVGGKNKHSFNFGDDEDIENINYIEDYMNLLF